MATVTVPLLVGLGMGLYEHITGHVFVENASKGDAIDMVQIKLVQRLPQLAKANATFYRAEVGAQEPVPGRFVV